MISDIHAEERVTGHLAGHFEACVRAEDADLRAIERGEVASYEHLRVRAHLDRGPAQIDVPGSVHSGVSAKIECRVLVHVDGTHVGSRVRAKP